MIKIKQETNFNDTGSVENRLNEDSEAHVLESNKFKRNDKNEGKLNKDKLIKYLIQKGINITKPDNNFGQRKASMFKVNKKIPPNSKEIELTNKENINVK